MNPRDLLDGQPGESTRFGRSLPLGVDNRRDDGGTPDDVTDLM